MTNATQGRPRTIATCAPRTGPTCDERSLKHVQDRFLALRRNGSPTVSSFSVSIEPGLTPVRLRTVGRKGFANGFVSSIKAGAPQPWQSKGERLGLENAEIDPKIIDFRSQPFTLHWRIGGETRSYTPDRIDDLGGGHLTCVEVKASHKALQRAGGFTKYEAARALLQQAEIDFRYEFADEMIESARAKLVARLMHYRRTPLYASDRALIDQLSGGLTTQFAFSQLIAAYGDQNLAFAKLASLLVRRIVSFDLDAGVTTDTPLSPLVDEAGGYA